MPEKPRCNKDAACNLDVFSHKKGRVATAACGDCDFLYEVGMKDHKNRKGSPNKGQTAGGLYVQGAAHGTIPKGLDIGLVANIVNRALHNPDILDHLTVPVVE